MEEENKILVKHLNHASFLIIYKKTSIVIDPFFSGEFFWQGHIEKQVNKPDIRLEDLPHIDAILCTHIHADHFEIETIFNIEKGDNSFLIAPLDVINVCIGKGFNRSQAIIGDKNVTVKIEDIKIICLPNKGSEQEHQCTRLSFVIEAGSKKIFHSGDSHGYSNTWGKYRGKIDLACLWCEDTEEIIENLQPVSVYLHHFEKFSPGDFSCNKDVLKMIKLLEKRFPEIKFYNPVEQKQIVL